MVVPPHARTWRQSLREALVVVVSILIAFGLDAASDARLEGRESVAALESLKSNFVSARDIVNEEGRRVESVQSSVEYLLALIHASRPDPPTDSVEQAIESLQELGNFGYPTGAYDALLGSGRRSSQRWVEPCTSLVRAKSPAILPRSAARLALRARKKTTA